MIEMSTLSIPIALRLTGIYWQPDYDPFTIPPEPNLIDDSILDEHGYWYTTGTMDGIQGCEARTPLIPIPFQKDYDSGYSDGSWWKKIFAQW